MATGRVFALKKASGKKNRRVLRSEIEHLSRLRDGPNILPLHDSLTDADGNLLLLTRFLNGGNLKEWIRSRGCLTEFEALSILDQMGKAITFAHGCNPPILHRDIKPSNILGKRTGSGRMQWYLADWGLAAAWQDADEPAVSGTYSYTPPEVWAKKRYPVSDVYALGMTFFYMLFGKPAYGGRSTSIRNAQRAPEPVTIPAGCPSRLKNLLQGMLEKNPDDRWPLHHVLTVIRKGGNRPPPSLSLRSRTPPGTLWTPPKTVVDLLFVRIPGGTFQMGHDDREATLLERELGETVYRHSFSRERPRHEVSLDGFWLGKYPVTLGQFRRFIEETGYQTDAEREGWSMTWNPESERFEKTAGANWQRTGFPQSEDHPVVNVSFGDATAMAEWLSKRCDRLIQLPTEAQWEYACRAGTTGFFHTGEKISTTMANFDGRFPLSGDVPGPFRQSTSPVTDFTQQANAWGLCDMHGNVWEWTRDWYQSDYYANSPDRNPRCSRWKSGERVIRGGSWSSPPARIRSASRDRYNPDNHDSDVGFRLAALSHPWEK